MKLVIATRNAHKLGEIKAVFNFHSLQVLSAFDFPNIPDVVEDGDTLEENAVKKAVEIARATDCWALADDSGLEVHALNGAPGVYSARYAGELCSATANNAKLLSELSVKKQRTACFRTVIALSDPDGKVETVEGVCSGVIVDTLRGSDGFGYDPLFVPDGYTETFAELGFNIKNTISHRSRALKLAQEQWREVLEAL
jgi:XTP/dITP diphosphohydrolase